MFSRALVDRILDSMPVARLAQLDLGGGPQALPFVFVRVDDCLWSPIDGKRKRSPALDRLSWLRERPDVLVLVDHYADDWSALWWLKIAGTAAIVHDEEPGWGSALAGLAQKYPQYGTTPMFAGTPTMVRIAIRTWKSWANAGEETVASLLRD